MKVHSGVEVIAEESSKFNLSNILYVVFFEKKFG